MALEQLGTTLSAKLEKVQNALQLVRDLATVTVGKLSEQLKLDEILKNIDDLWLTAEVDLNTLIQQLEDQIQPIRNNISTVVQPVRIVLYSIGGFLLLLVVIAFLQAARLLYRSFRDKLYKDPDCIEVGTCFTYHPHVSIQ